MVGFIDENRDEYGVEPLCSSLPIAPSTYRLYKAREANPNLEPDRTRRDRILIREIQQVWDENRKVYGARKVWKVLKKQRQLQVARCTVERLMRSMGLRGVIRGKGTKTTFPSPKDERPEDLVNRDFSASKPNQLWVADFTYGAPGHLREPEAIGDAGACLEFI